MIRTEFMKFLLSILFLTNIAIANGIVSMDKIGLTRGDHIIGEHMVNLMKLIEKGYVSQDVLNKILVETSKSQHYTIRRRKPRHA